MVVFVFVFVFIDTLASVVWGPQQAERQITGVMGYDFLYPVMNDMVPSVSDCSNKNVRDIGQNDPRETACWLIEVSIPSEASRM